MQPRVERERLLKLQDIEALALERVENQVPAVPGDRARNRHETMVAKKSVAEGLLARAHNPWNQPIGIRHVAALDDMNLCAVGDPRRRDHVRRYVKRLKARVQGNLARRSPALPCARAPGS